MNHSSQSRPPLHQRNASTNSLSSRISTLSDITDFDSFSNDDLNINSEENGTTYARAPLGWSALTSYSSSSPSYEPLSSPKGLSPPPRRQNSRPFGHAVSLRKRHEAIPEEDGIDLGLITSAAPMGAVPIVAEEPPTPITAFDLSSSLGPTTLADQAFMRALQEQEAQGRLTGGLGAGIKTDAIVTETALLASSPVAERSPIGRSLSRRQSRYSWAPSRRDTLRQLGQSEANKRGEVIEVIIEEPQEVVEVTEQSEVDLSVMSGPETGLSLRNSMRQCTFPTKKGATQVFYPQPDWKPLSMRWPYLMSLIIVSIVLGGSQELLYQKSARKPLITFQTPAEIPGAEYFSFKFLPTLIAVSYGVLWQITDFEIRRLEAFYQMSKEGGALAAESINVDYITSFNFLRPFRALQCKHYAVAVSSVASLLANALVPTLGAACIVLDPSREQRINNPTGDKHILISGVWSRFLTVTFFIIAFLGCVLFYQLESRRSGLLADVKGIAGLASMATVSHILMDFKDMDVATHEGIHDRLKNHRYVLRNSSLAPDELNPPSSQEMGKYTKNHLSQNPQPLMLRAKGALPFIIGIFLFMALIPIILFTRATILTDKAPWIVTALAVCIKLSWGALETDVRMMEPYYILSRRHAPPKTLTLDYTAMPFGWVAFRGMLNGHWLVFFVGFGTVMTELLTVFVTSLATVEGRVFIALSKNPPSPSQPNEDGKGVEHDFNAGQETVPSFWISLALATFILLYMGVVAGVVFMRRRRVFLPRQPNTIASVLAFIHQSKMLYDFVGTSKLSNADMVRRLEDVGKTYGLGWFQGRDGQSHCGVDEEELVSGYKFGFYNAAVMYLGVDIPGIAAQILTSSKTIFRLRSRCVVRIRSDLVNHNGMIAAAVLVVLCFQSFVDLRTASAIHGGGCVEDVMYECHCSSPALHVLKKRRVGGRKEERDAHPIHSLLSSVAPARACLIASGPGRHRQPTKEALNTGSTGKSQCRLDFDVRYEVRQGDGWTTGWNKHCRSTYLFTLLQKVMVNFEHTRVHITHVYPVA
ncbi:hypothetical protein B0T17DRAFT_503138 [Bombardia bombarda]|uniref:Uncharacterized protein n=1 Tax=Bombardia bombarda TaxID=252184 RepID=A0AA39XKC8_9PEZI|nr:hypothetical protein B0T17DRAFT_503138 [Bombardia bombarda]